MPVPFRFDTVLRVREAERDRSRQALVLEQLRQASLIDERNRVTADRLEVLDALRLAHQGNGLPADQELARRQYADYLATEIERLTTALYEVRGAIALRRNELLEADTAVKALEKLAGRHAADQQQIEFKNAERERDDTWRPGRVA